MLIGVITNTGGTYVGTVRLPNTICGVPAGARIKYLLVDGRVEPADIEATGEPIVIALPVIRRIREQKRVA